MLLVTALLRRERKQEVSLLFLLLIQRLKGFYLFINLLRYYESRLSWNCFLIYSSFLTTVF